MNSSHRDRERRPFDIEAAKREDSVTGLLDLLLAKKYDAARTHEGMDVIRSVLEGSKEIVAPVVDLAALLPDLGSHQLIGLHIASYCPFDDQEWYPRLLDRFFTTGIGGSLLALKGFEKCVGKYRLRDSRRDHQRPPAAVNEERVTISDDFPPKPNSVDSDIDERFDEYASLLFEHFDHSAKAVWICFGARESTSVHWGGSLFLVLQPVAGRNWKDWTQGEAVEALFSILNAAFHRVIVNSVYKDQLELTYFTFGHELKDRIDSLGLAELQNKVHASAPELLADVVQCRRRVKSLRGLAGVFSIVAKSQDGVLPNKWIAPSDIPGTTYVPTEASCRELESALISAVTNFVYTEAAGDHMNLRHVGKENVEDILRPISFDDPLLPFFNPTSQEPHLCFLSGLGELCRNAARAVLSASPKYVRPHLDFSVEISCDASFIATVNIFNPIVGNQNEPSESVAILQDLFMRLNHIVELRQAQIEDSYPYALVPQTYVRSQFAFYPKRINSMSRPFRRKA